MKEEHLRKEVYLYGAIIFQAWGNEQREIY